MKVYNPNAIGVTTGFGVPAGGTSGQVLVKSTSTNYDTQWSDTGTYRVFTPGGGVTTLSGVSIASGEAWECTFFPTDINRPQGAISMKLYRNGTYVSIQGTHNTTVFTGSTNTGTVTITNPLFGNTIGLNNYQFFANTFNLDAPGGVLILRKLY